MAYNVDVEYENTIKLYQNNNYVIISQTDNTTIMLSHDFQKMAGKLSNVNALASSLQGNSKDAISNANTAHNEAQTYKTNYQVIIRITKTGVVDVSGYTLDKRTETNNKRKFTKKEIGIILGICAVLFPLIIFLLIYFESH